LNGRYGPPSISTGKNYVNDDHGWYLNDDDGRNQWGGNGDWDLDGGDDFSDADLDGGDDVSKDDSDDYISVGSDSHPMRGKYMTQVCKKKTPPCESECYEGSPSLNKETGKTQKQCLRKVPFRKDKKYHGSMDYEGRNNKWKCKSSGSRTKCQECVCLNNNNDCDDETKRRCHSCCEVSGNYDPRCNPTNDYICNKWMSS
jgi:hypothetical protein